MIKYESLKIYDYLGVLGDGSFCKSLECLIGFRGYPASARVRVHLGISVSFSTVPGWSNSCFGSTREGITQSNYPAANPSQPRNVRQSRGLRTSTVEDWRRVEILDLWPRPWRNVGLCTAFNICSGWSGEFEVFVKGTQLFRRTRVVGMLK